jgi:hypothetical protein
MRRLALLLPLKVLLMLVNISEVLYTKAFPHLRRRKRKRDRAMLAFRLAVLLAVLCLGEACSYLRLSKPYDADSPVVRELAPIQRTLQEADAASAHVLLTEAGKTTYPEFEAPIWRLAYRPFQPGLKQVLILAGIHGNETSGVNYLVQFIQGLAQRSGSSPACDMDIIPIVNPWGYVHNLPFNRNGVDVGRDFSDFDSHEARVARRFLREKRYDLVLDLREDPEADGFCIWQYGLDDAGAAGRTVSQVQTAGYPIAHDTSLMFLKPRNGIVAAPLWGLTFLRLSRQLTIAGYIRRNVSNVVFTVVAPAGLPLEDRIAMQRMAVETFLDQYGATR